MVQVENQELEIGKQYKVFDPRFGTFDGELIDLNLQQGWALIKHAVGGVPDEIECNLAYCGLSI